MSSASPSSVTAPLSTGAVFHGRYRIVRALKAGGMGAVYEVVDENTAAPRALKVMLPSTLADADQRARFALEARVTGIIDSDHLVRVSDSGVDEASGSPFLVMELLRGEELGDMLARQKTLPPAEVLTYLGQASLALDKTHAAGIVHRDIKPDNLMVARRDDGSPCLKILDFGIAKVVAQNQQKTRALGTPLYMSPEQVKGESAIGPRADLYSLAQVAYTLLVGEPYWTEDAAGDESLYALLMKVIAGATEPPTARALRRSGMRLPPGFDPWFFKATAAAHEARFDRATVQTAALAEVFAAPPPSHASAARVTGAIPSAVPSTVPAGHVTGAIPSSLPPTQPSTGSSAPATAATPQRIPTAAYQPPPSVASPVVPFAQQPFAPAPFAQQPFAPPPFAPQVPPPPVAAPPRSRGPLIAIAVVGGVMAVGLVLVGVALLGGGSGGGGVATVGADGGSTAPITGCPPTATCSNLDIADPTHADATTIFPAVEKLAKASDSRVILAMIAGDLTKDGSVDLTGGERQLAYMWAIPGSMVSIVMHGKTAAVMRTNPFGHAAVLPEPRCSTKAAWKAAVAAGMPAVGGVTFVYSLDLSLGLPGWALTTTKFRYFVDNKTCTVKSSMKF